ncbi:MAG: DUF3604 domain-containing protein [Parasphingorhabdus sp.]
MRKIYWIGLGIVAIGAAAFLYIQHSLSAPLLTDEDIAAMKADVLAQDETAFTIPGQIKAATQDANPLKNAYFGDLHVHSDQSFDSYIFGNRLTLDQSYRFAKGEILNNPAGEKMQLTVPLDFAAVTDHAEGFGLFELCADNEKSDEAAEFCEQRETPNYSLFMDLRKRGEQRPVASFDDISGNATKMLKFANSTWQKIVATAEKHNEPGRFTTFAAYEYSPVLPDRGKLHRNVIFRNNTVPNHAISSAEAQTELDLWAGLIRDCKEPCAFLTIPHNPNRTWGLAFASHTIDGDEYTDEDWQVRAKVEPLVEMYQIKGNSECSIGFGTSDEECGFEQYLPRCEEGQETGCIHPTSMARDGLKKGLLLDKQLGVNPFRFGMIGSTDTHLSNPGDTEAWDFRGFAGMLSASAKTRLAPGRNGDYGYLYRTPGGLAAIWAEENTREALFAAMQRKEVYATSGTRIKLRFFGGFEYNETIADAQNSVQTAYANGVPMGGQVAAVADKAPTFFIWAMRDPLSAPLDRVQIVKGWTENGEAKEKVRDIICSEDRPIDPSTGRCPAISAKVNLKNCAVDKDRGAPELRTFWRDEQYRPGENAFYYIRVIQNPTCRWSTYDSLRLDQVPSDRVSATNTEMAWSSPIWFNALTR